MKLFTWGLVFSMTSSPSPSCPVSPWPTVRTCPLPLVGQHSLLWRRNSIFSDNFSDEFGWKQEKESYNKTTRSPGVPKCQNQGSVVDISFPLLCCLPIHIPACSRGWTGVWGASSFLSLDLQVNKISWGRSGIPGKGFTDWGWFLDTWGATASALSTAKDAEDLRGRPIIRFASFLSF